MDGMMLILGGLLGMFLTVILASALVSVRKEERDAARAERDDLRRKLALATSTGVDLAPLVGWRKETLMNKPEFSLFLELQTIVSRGSGAHRVFPQVAFGAFVDALAREDRKEIKDAAYHSVHRKIADFLIIDRYGKPCAVVEYQGAGHYQGNAHARDHVKRVVCQRAGIAFIEVAQTGLTTGQLMDLHRLMGSAKQLAAE